LNLSKATSNDFSIEDFLFFFGGWVKTGLICFVSCSVSSVLVVAGMLTSSLSRAFIPELRNNNNNNNISNVVRMVSSKPVWAQYFF